MFRINIVDTIPIDLSNIYETLNREVIPESVIESNIDNNSILNFMLLAFDDKNIKNSSIFTDNKYLNIQFKDLYETYQKFTIYRIKMLYLNLNNKMHLLESIRMIDYDSGNKFMKLFNYEEIKTQADTLEIFLKFYFNFNILLECFDELMSKFRYLNSAKINNMVIRENHLFISKIKGKIKILSSYCLLFNDSFDRYLSSINNFFMFMENRLSDIKNFEYFKDDYEETIANCKLELEKSQSFINSMLNDFDTKIKCTYFIAFGNYETKIIITGISNYIYMNVSELYDLNPKNISYDDSFLAKITEAQICDIFNFSLDYNSRFIHVYFNNLSMFIKFIYTIDEEIPDNKVYLKIENIPKYNRILNSMITSKSKQMLIISHKDYSILNWLKKLSYYDHYTNKELLNHIYNIVFVNQDKYLNDNILSSFEKLAYRTSYDTYN